MLKRLFNKKSAFTLTELLIALTILGAISAMAIPNLIEGLQGRSLAAQLKSTYGDLQEVAREQMIANNTKNLLDTDFASAGKLLTDKNFKIAKKCTSAAECWNQTYRSISKASMDSRKIEGNPKTVILKNGQILSYQPSILAYKIDGGKDRAIGLFYLDVNGTDKPNMMGRDVFWFYISEKGKVVDQYLATGTTYNKTTATNNCKTGATITGCFSVIMRNNWVFDY
jgi:prepilin-type N-terminal cleavage/methylation domain-containing protein